MFKYIFISVYKSAFQREITKKLGNPKQPTNPFLEMIKFLLERIAPVHIDTESIRYLDLSSKSPLCVPTVQDHSHVSARLPRQLLICVCMCGRSPVLSVYVTWLLMCSPPASPLLLYYFTSESSEDPLWVLLFYLGRKHS